MTSVPASSEPGVGMLRVLVVENDPLAAEAVQLVCGSQGIDVQTVLSPDLAALVDVCSGADHDLVIIDLYLHPGEADGIELAVKLKDHRPEASIAIWTSSEDPIDASRAWSAGVQAFLTKRRLLAARDQIPSLLRWLAGGAVHYQVDPRLDEVTQQILSAREIEVLQRKLDGRTYREIADALFLSPRTIDSHLANIRTKLDADSIGDALARAVDLGLVVRQPLDQR